MQVGARRNKLNTLVDFPVRGMDMSDHILHRNQAGIDHGIYDLYGVCNHYGNMLGGHYTGKSFKLTTQKILFFFRL